MSQLFDIPMIVEFASELGISTKLVNENLVECDIGYGMVLCFENFAQESDTINDTIIYFTGEQIGWHTHGDVYSTTSEIELVPLNILQGIHEGKLLVERRQTPDGKIELSLREVEDSPQLKYMEAGEVLTFIRVPLKAFHE